MPGLGTIINACCIVAGGLAGLLGKRFISDRLQDALLKACGLSVIFLGIGGTMEKMLAIATAADGAMRLSSGGTMMILVSLAVGSAVGDMAIVGAIQDGLTGDYTTLMLKGAIDAVIVCAMTASMGKGCIFAALPVGAWQGLVTAASTLLQPVMTQAALDNLGLVGSILIFCVGVNLIWPRTFKPANMLPAVVVAVACAFVM